VNPRARPDRKKEEKAEMRGAPAAPCFGLANEPGRRKKEKEKMRGIPGTFSGLEE
jgi:hypothetical protein